MNSHSLFFDLKFEISDKDIGPFGDVIWHVEAGHFCSILVTLVGNLAVRVIASCINALLTFQYRVRMTSSWKQKFQRSFCCMTAENSPVFSWWNPVWCTTDHLFRVVFLCLIIRFGFKSCPSCNFDSVCFMSGLSYVFIFVLSCFFVFFLHLSYIS